MSGAGRSFERFVPVVAEIGIDIQEDPESIDYFVKAGATADGFRVRFPRGMCREIIQKNAPSIFTQHARNPENNVVIGGNNTVLVPAYGPPFVYSKEGGRRYASIEDFRNFVKLAYMSPSLHHSGGTVCEPVDLPVNKRHYDMVYSHIKYSDKAFMGSVTAPRRALDSALSMTPQPPSSIAQHMTAPKGLDAICAKALEKDPDKRYRNMMEMIRDIRQFREEKNCQTGSPHPKWKSP